MIGAGTSASNLTGQIKAPNGQTVNEKEVGRTVRPALKGRAAGTNSLPLLGEHQSGRQRAFLKIQDGCDAHCTYCIIPQLRPHLWSKPIDDVVEEATRLVACGHLEIVLTGIFLGAFGQPTALRRKQPREGVAPLARLIEALCTRVPGMRRLRLSSLEPGDLNKSLVSVLRSHAHVVPHFHLPLQSGSDAQLHRMNRQYTSDAYLRMIDQVREAFDRPAITTDVIVGFPGESEEEFGCTLRVVDYARFIHIHAFGFSPRPGTAAARWKEHFIHGPVINERINLLRERAARYSYHFRRQFIDQQVELLIERDPAQSDEQMHHGRCERYFDVWLEEKDLNTGDLIIARVTRVTPTRTFGEFVSRGGS